MRALVCVLVAVLMLAGAGLYAMEPASAGAGVGQAEPARERAKAMPFKPGSEPAKGFADADLEWGADVREFPKLAFSACDVYGFADLCLYRVEVPPEEAEEVEIGLLFWRDRLFGVELTTQGRKNWAHFRSMVFGEFGGPTEPVDGQRVRVGGGEGPGAPVLLAPEPQGVPADRLRRDRGRDGALCGAGEVAI